MTSDIIIICKDINSEKGAERRKAAVSLKNCLNQSSMKKALDKKYEEKQIAGKKARIFTWENVFRAVTVFVRLETEDLAKANENVGKATKTKRETQKQEVSGLVKCVIRAADQGSPKLKGSLLFEHVLEILRDPFYCDSYGQDYCSILLKNVLSVRKYTVELTSTEWHDMVFMFCKLFNDPDVRIDRLVLARIIHSLITSLTVQCDVKAKKILAFFTDFFVRSKQQESSVIVQYILLALNVFMKTIAPTSRVQVCKLGEEVLQNMLYLWHNLATDNLKDCLLEFFQVQMWCHHPRGEKQGSEGAYALDWDRWMSHLRKLYELLYNEIKLCSNKNRSKDCILKPAFVDLAVDVCQQLFSDTSHSIDVTQIASSLDTQSAGPSVKRRRLESGWEALRNVISTAGQSLKLVPWLQLITGLVQKYPGTLPQDEVLPFLTCLSHIITDCKRADLMIHIQCCIKAFASNWNQVITKPHDQLKHQSKPIWNQIWMAALRFVSLHHAEPDVYVLLTAMVEQNLVTPKHDIWTLFNPTVTQPITESVCFLTKQITVCDLPENFVPNVLVSMETSSNDTKYPLRKQLIHWLLPSREDEGESSNSTSKLDPHWLACALATLTLRDPSSVKEVIVMATESSVSELERLYLETSLESQPRCKEVVCNHGNKDTCSESVHISVLLLEVENVVKREVQYMCSRCEEQVSDVMVIVTLAQTVAELLSILLQYKIITAETIPNCGMYAQLVTLLKKTASLLSPLIKKDGQSVVLPVIVALGKLFKWSDCTEEVGGVMSYVCQAATSASLTDTLLDIATGKYSSKPTCSRNMETTVTESRFNRSRARILDFDDDDDFDFDDMSNNNSAMDVDDDMDFNDEPNSQESDETTSTMEVCPSLLSAHLSESQSVRLAAVETLCHWCRRAGTVSREIKLKPEVDVKYLKSKLVNMLKEDVFDPNRSFDLQTMMLMVKLLTEEQGSLSSKELVTMVTAIRYCVSKHRKDQEVCCACIDLLIRLVPHLSDSNMGASGSLRECRESVLHLTTAFWKLETGYTSLVRQNLAALLEKLLECDPSCKWSRFLSEDEENSPESQGAATGPSPADRLINCLADNCLLVRMKVSGCVHKLFIESGASGQVPVDRETQEQMFSLVFKELNELLDMCYEFTLKCPIAEKVEDFRTSVDASILITLGAVICASSVCESLALFSILKFVQEKNLAVEKVIKLLQKVSGTLGYESTKKYVVNHLPYLLHKWITAGYVLSTFPYKLLACNNLKSFYREHVSVIIPELVNRRDLACVQAVSTEVDIPHTDLLMENIPRIVTYILPVFAAGKKANKASASYNLLIEQLTEELIERQIVNNLDEIIVNILMTLHDTDSDTGIIRDTNPTPNPPHFNSVEVTTTLDYITRSFSGSDKSLVEILSKTPDSIQNILLKMSTCMWLSHQLAEKRRILSMYQLFTRQLLRYFHTQLGGAWAFVLRDIVTRLVYLIRDVTADPIGQDTKSCYRESIASTALELLKEVCQTASDSCSKELVKYLGLITSNLVTVAEIAGDVGQQSLSLLKFLVLEKAGDLRAGIASLDNFPERPLFKDCRIMHHKLKYAAGAFTLKQEVEHFLVASVEHTVDGCLRLEGLQFLFEQLQDARHDLHTLSQDETLCRLVCKLVELSRCDNQSVIQATGKCLGVLGPIDMKTICFPAPPTSLGLQKALTCFEEVPSAHKYCKVFHKLNDYLTDKSIELVECASSVLKALLSVKTGSEFAAGYKAKLGDMEYLFHYLHPFRGNKKKAVKVDIPSVNWDRFQDSVDQESLWNPHGCNHSNWVITLTTTLINSGAVRDEILQLVGPVCQIKSEFCELVLPYLVHDVLVSGNEEHKDVLSRQMARFFSTHCGQTSGRVSRCHSLTMATLYSDDDYICMNVDSVRTMLDVVQYLRQQHRPKQGRKEMTPWDNNFWLDLDYLHVAMAAQYCSAHFSALLFAEIWCDVQRDRSETGGGSQSQRSSQSLSQDTRIDTLSDASNSQSGVSVQDLLLEAYNWIGDPDGVYGCGAGRKADSSSRICTYQQENQWEKAVVSCDIEMSQSEQSNSYELLHALQSFGTNHVLTTYLRGMVGQDGTPNLSSDTRELQYEAAWKIGQWNLDVPNKPTKSPGFHECMFKALKSAREDHVSLADKTLDVARVCAMSRLREGCLDSTKKLYTVMADLQCVNIVNSVAAVISRKADQSSVKLVSDTVYSDTDFLFTVPVLHMQCTALHLLMEKSRNNKHVYTNYVNSVQQLAVAAREAGRHQISERAIATLKQLDIHDLCLGLPCKIEEARLFWARGEQNIAKHLIRTTIDKLNKLRKSDRTAARYYPEALGIYGNWLAETRSENPNIIMEQYMEKTIRLFEELGNDKATSVDAYLSLARYADSQYQNIVNYMKSSTYEAKQSLMLKAQQEAERLQEVMGESAKDRYLQTLVKQTRIDQHEVECMEEDRNLFLLKAVENYIKCLKFGDSHNLRVFRLTSLWFNNVSNEDVNTMMQDGIRELKPYKWLPLMYQLAARMDVKPHKDTPQDFLDTLNKLIYDTAVTHPHHTLFCVLALANANRDMELLQQGKANKRGSKLSKSQPDATIQEGRVLAAKQMVQKLRQDRGVGAIVKDMETVCDAYIQLANWNVSQYKTSTKPIPLPEALWISKVKNLQNVPVPTKEIKVNPSGDYKNISYIAKFESTFKLAGGINLPKIISCIGSDGTKSRQLVKGRDDLRQDAVMQQVFDMVNNLLQKDLETRKRQLQIRKYKVIPLSQRSGLLEWCEGTQPIGEYLIGSSAGVKGAHTRYRPKDLTAMDCRKQMAGATADSKNRAYQEICENFRPVFRHFFLERFYCPPVWFERRLAYTRSVATNSIVGYILGLGDRHPQNILIDCNSAELVHIDLGVAFEQGRILPTPETVPFRLTRDIEDAMGASGVEGVFRRCCEKTMDVMRNNQEALLTILEVLLYDPLHAWTISPAKMYALQQRRDRGDSNDTVDINNTTTGDLVDMVDSNSTRNSSDTQESVNKLAERVLLRLHQKLQGVEDGVQLSLSGQVNHLIQEARNPKNLARLFAGWQPFI